MDVLLLKINCCCTSLITSVDPIDDLITITCLGFNFFTFPSCNILSELNQNGYMVRKTFSRGKYDPNNILIDFVLDGRNVRILKTSEYRSDVDVCILNGWLLGFPLSLDDIKRRVSYCQDAHPTAPIIIFGHWGHSKHDIALQGHYESTQNRPINRKSGDEFAREVGAVKYVECSHKTGRGYKILFDEIAFAYFSKLKDEEEKAKEAEEDKIRQQNVKFERQRQDKVDRNLLIFFVLAFAMLIFTIVLIVLQSYCSWITFATIF